MGHRYGWAYMREERLRRLKSASTHKIPHLLQFEPHDGHCAIVGAAPSVESQLDNIRAIKNKGNGIVISINKTHDYLIKHGITPNIHVIFEIDLKDTEQSLGGKPNKDTVYYVCSHCHEDIFEQLKDHPCVLWHFYDDPPEYQATVGRLYPDEFMVAGGFVTFFRALNIAMILGFRDFDLFGCDCSFGNNSSHFDGYNLKHEEPRLVVSTGPDDTYPQYNTNPSLSFLAHEFMSFCAANQKHLLLRVNGDSLMQSLHKKAYPDQYSSKGID